MENLNLIIEKINALKNSKHKFFNKAKLKRIEYYKNRLINYPNSFDDLPIEKINNHDFLSEILEQSFILEKIDYFKKYKYSKIDKLEVHVYSPEQNKLLFNKSEIFISVPNCFTIQEAINYIIINQSLEQIKTI